MKAFKVLFAFMLISSTLCYAQDDEKSEFKLLDNVSVNNIVYGVNSKSSSSQFTLQICDNANCHTTRAYVMSITPQLLVNDVLAFIKTNLDSTLVVATVLQTEKDQIAQLINKVQVVETKKVEAKKTEAERLYTTIDEEKDQYSGLLMLNKIVPCIITYLEEREDKTKTKKDSIPIASSIDKERLDEIIKILNDSTFVQNMNTKEGLSGQVKYNNRIVESKKYDDTKFVKIEREGVIEIKNAKVHFFNNRANSIYIEAEFTYNNITEKLIFVNSRFSVPIRYFNIYGSNVTAFSKQMINGQRLEVKIDYNDVFDYESDQFFNYSVANDQVSLSNENKNASTGKVIQRRFFDFFTGIVYTDVMGFNAENSNSILNAQGKLLLPLSLINKSEATFARQFTTIANIALNNSFEDESRFIAIKDDETFSNFDLLRKNNLYGKLNLDIFTYESKGWFLNTSLGYSAAFYRTGFRYTQTQTDDTDIITSRQLLSVGHGPYLNFEIRPQTNFGADVIISLEDFNYTDTKVINGRSFKNDIIVDGGKNHFVAKYNLVNIEANFYWLTSPNKSKGGVYAKLGSYYHTKNHSIYPQLMVGYATNLTSFVNRFKPKKEIEETE